MVRSGASVLAVIYRYVCQRTDDNFAEVKFADNGKTPRIFPKLIVPAHGRWIDRAPNGKTPKDQP
jgi:hypothetical protein